MWRINFIPEKFARRNVKVQNDIMKSQISLPESLIRNLYGGKLVDSTIVWEQYVMIENYVTKFQYSNTALGIDTRGKGNRPSSQQLRKKS